jgi:hypothetical protein
VLKKEVLIQLKKLILPKKKKAVKKKAVVTVTVAPISLF